MEKIFRNKVFLTTLLLVGISISSYMQYLFMRAMAFNIEISIIFAIFWNAGTVFSEYSTFTFRRLAKGVSFMFMILLVSTSLLSTVFLRAYISEQDYRQKSSVLNRITAENSDFEFQKQRIQNTIKEKQEQINEFRKAEQLRRGQFTRLLNTLGGDEQLQEYRPRFVWNIRNLQREIDALGKEYNELVGENQVQVITKDEISLIESISNMLKIEKESFMKWFNLLVALIIEGIIILTTYFLTRVAKKQPEITVINDKIVVYPETKKDIIIEQQREPKSYEEYIASLRVIPKVDGQKLRKAMAYDKCGTPEQWKERGFVDISGVTLRRMFKGNYDPRNFKPETVEKLKKLQLRVYEERRIKFIS